MVTQIARSWAWKWDTWNKRTKSSILRAGNWSSTEEDVSKLALQRIEIATYTAELQNERQNGRAQRPEPQHAFKLRPIEEPRIWPSIIWIFGHKLLNAIWNRSSTTFHKPKIQALRLRLGSDDANESRSHRHQYAATIQSQSWVSGVRDPNHSAKDVFWYASSTRRRLEPEQVLPLSGKGIYYGDSAVTTRFWPSTNLSARATTVSADVLQLGRSLDRRKQASSCTWFQSAEVRAHRSDTRAGSSFFAAVVNQGTFARCFCQLEFVNTKLRQREGADASASPPIAVHATTLATQPHLDVQQHWRITWVGSSPAAPHWQPVTI